MSTKKYFLAVYIIIISATMMCFERPLYASTYCDFVRINKVYVLYTDPIVPHTDSEGNTWVGLQAFTLLIGGQFVENPQGMATAVFRGRRMTWVPGAKTVTIDGKIIRLAVSAKRIGKYQRIVVPLRPLLSALRIRWHLDKQYHVLTLIEPNLLSKGTAGDFAQQVAEFEGPPSEPAAQARAFVGPPFPIAPIVPVAITQTGPHLVLRLHNVSAKNFPQIDINLLVSGQRGEEFIKSGIPFPASFPNAPSFASIEAGGALNYKLSTADEPTNHYHGDPLSSPGGGIVTVTYHPVANILVWIVP